MPDQERRIIGIVSAKGGSGRTVLAIALASRFAEGAYWAPNGSYAPGLLSGAATQYEDPIATLPAVLATDSPTAVVEAAWDHAFAVARMADVVLVPTRTDLLAMQVLHQVTIPLLVATATPAVLYVVDETEASRQPTSQRELDRWRETAERFDSVVYAPWRPSGFPLPAHLAVALDSATPVRPHAEDELSAPACHLYRHLAADGSLLYVGISGDPVFRFRNGHKDKAWVHEVATVDVESFPTREMARTAELIAIAKERPLHNIADRPRAVLAADEDWDEDDADEMAS